jgi:hypothetical protein
MTNRKKSVGYFLFSMAFTSASLFFHENFTTYIISLINPELALKANFMMTESYDRYHNIVFYSCAGLSLFYLLCSLKYFLLDKRYIISQLLKYSYLCTLIFQIIVIFVFTDIILQNWGGENTTIANFSMRYQSIGGLIAVEFCVICNYFSTINKKTKES